MTTGLSTVRDAPERHRFEIEVDGDLVGFVRYRRRPGAIEFMHTEIDPEREGGGLGGVLVAAALREARSEGVQVLPFCPFVRSYIDHHGEYVDLVPEERRAEFGLNGGG